MMKIAYYDKNGTTGTFTSLVSNSIASDLEQINPSSPFSICWQLALVHIDDTDFHKLVVELGNHQVLIRFSSTEQPPLRYPSPAGIAANCIKRIGVDLEEAHLTHIVKVLSKVDESLDELFARELRDSVPLWPYHSLRALEIIIMLRQLGSVPIETDQIITAVGSRRKLDGFLKLLKADAANADLTKEVESLAAWIEGHQSNSDVATHRDRVQGFLGIGQLSSSSAQ